MMNNWFAWFCLLMCGVNLLGLIFLAGQAWRIPNLWVRIFIACPLFYGILGWWMLGVFAQK
jgi:hypothetical protein